MQDQKEVEDGIYKKLIADILELKKKDPTNMLGLKTLLQKAIHKAYYEGTKGGLEAIAEGMKEARDKYDIKK